MHASESLLDIVTMLWLIQYQLNLAASTNLTIGIAKSLQSNTQSCQVNEWQVHSKLNLT